MNAGPSEQHLANALRHAYWSYARVTRLVSSRRLPEMLAEADAIYREGWPRLQTITVPALKHVGRNGACPCGSNRKTKDCHGAL
jgi:uncharacterized protein YecA (UPF0149 family)